MTPNRPFGVSFVIRVRNEEATLEKALRSLEGVKIPHELIVILNRCTDDSVKIALRCSGSQPVKIGYDDRVLSRAGAENLITDAVSDHSLTSYYNHSFSRAAYRWTFKYDADFIASGALVRFLNEELSSFEAPTRIRLPCRWEGIANEEVYLSNCLLGFMKHIFWESPRYEMTSAEVLRRDIPIEHLSPMKEVKRYWREAPWFLFHDTAEAKDLRRRHEALSKIVGEEPLAAARASNPACDEYFRRVVNERSKIEAAGISFVR